MQTTADPQQADGGPAGADAVAPAPVRTCGTCQAAMLPDQDWCLACGTAAPGRLGTRPGWQSVNTVAALTLILVVGAVAAAYAALSGDANNDAGKAAGASAAPVPGQVAQVPDAAPTTPPATTTPATTTPPGVLPPALSPGTAPPGATVTPGTTVTPGAAPVIPIVPSAPVVPITPVTPVTPPSSGTSTPPSTSTPTSTTTTPRSPSSVTLTKIDLGADALSKYEPSKRSTASTDPADAYDGNAKTAWSITTPADGFDMQVGLLIDLDSAKNVKEIDLGTTTPGGRVEVYGAVGSALPPDILDTRWEHVLSQSKVDQGTKVGNVAGDGVEKLRLPGPGATGGRFRYVLLWFTTPPKAGPTMKVTEVTLKG